MLPAGPLRAAVRERHRQRHRAATARAHLRSVLHDQGRRRRHRPGPVAGARHRHRPGRRHRGGAVRSARGTTFTVYLPWQHYRAERGRGRRKPSPAGNGQTVLLVDDEEALVRLGEEMLAELGYEPVGFTSSARGARGVPRRARPLRRVLLTDEAMPDMTGLGAVAEIRRLRPDMPIVLMTGYRHRRRCERARADRSRRRARQAAGVARHRAQPRQCAGVGAKRAHVR